MPLVNPLNQIGKIGVDSVNPDSVDYPRSVTTSLSLAKRIPLDQVLEVGYVGTFGRHLLNRRQFNVIQPGTFLQGTIGNSNLSIPVNRVALDAAAVTAQRPFPALSYVRWWEYTGTSNYHSLQATLSRQTGKRFQYFIAYTYSKVLGTMFENGEYDDIDPFDPRHRSYGVLAYDRTHILNVSYNYQVPDLIHKGGVLGSLINGWQVSGITSWASGIPISLGFIGDIATGGMNDAWWGTPDHVGYRILNQVSGNGSAIMPVFTCNPVLGGAKKVGDKLLDVNCLAIPKFGESGPFTSPQYIRLPSRPNFDLTVFKNFRIGDPSGNRKVQIRLGAFDIFNQAVAGTGGQDVDLRLDTRCNVKLNGVPNGVGGTVDNICDPTQGFSYTPQTLQNFGKIILKRGHRVVEVAAKLYF